MRKSKLETLERSWNPLIPPKTKDASQKNQNSFYITSQPIR